MERDFDFGFSFMKINLYSEFLTLHQHVFLYQRRSTQSLKKTAWACGSTKVSGLAFGKSFIKGSRMQQAMVRLLLFFFRRLKIL
jgi:hypothetical protein